MLLEDFYNEVLQKLGVLAAEESASASDRSEVKTKYEQVHAELAERELLPFFDDEAVDDLYADPLATLVASRLTHTFSVPIDKRVELKRDGMDAEGRIAGTGQHRDPPESKGVYY